MIRSQATSRGGGLTMRQALVLAFVAAGFCVFRFAPKLQRLVRRDSSADGPLVMRRTKTAAGGYLYDGPRKAAMLKEDSSGEEEAEEDLEEEGDEGSDDDPAAANEPEPTPVPEAETGHHEHEEGHNHEGAGEEATKKLRGKGGGKDEAKKETKSGGGARAASSSLDPYSVPPLPEDKIVRPVRDSTLAPEERPLEGEAGKKERGVTSPAFEAATQHSINPPFWLNPREAQNAAAHPLAKEWPSVLSKVPEALTFADTSDELVRTTLGELQRRLIIGIVMGVHSGNTRVAEQGLISLPVFNTLMPTFLASASSSFTYRLVFAFDHNDPIYESAEQRGKIEAEVHRLVAEANKVRWHPPGYKHGETVDGSTLLVSLHWVHCGYAGKPAWAHSDAAVAAFKEGADYAFRPNDDTAFPSAPDWPDRFISDLRKRKPVPNLGVVGPACGQGASWILTHDFTHRTHPAIFGVHYPRSLPDWSSDDWITVVWRQFGLMSRREDAPVEHRMHGQRYKNQGQAERLQNLNSELQKGAEAINDWVEQRYGLRLPYKLETITCC